MKSPAIDLLFLRSERLCSRSLDSLSISRHGKSSGELSFSDDFKPEVREQSGKAAVV
jgi:hypothetical protein